MIKLSDDINIKSGKDDDNTEVWKKKKRKKKRASTGVTIQFSFFQYEKQLNHTGD